MARRDEVSCHRLSIIDVFGSSPGLHPSLGHRAARAPSTTPSVLARGHPAVPLRAETASHSAFLPGTAHAPRGDDGTIRGRVPPRRSRIMKRIVVWTWCLAAAGSAFTPSPAAAQLSGGVQVSWHWSDDGWRSGPVVDGYVQWSDRTARRDRAPARALPARRARLRIPPGHMPPAGLCRVWIVGVPPGHQPPPRRCSRALFAHQGPSTVILHTPLRDGRWWSPGRDAWRDERRWDRSDRWDDDCDDRWDDDRDDERGKRWKEPGHSGRGSPPGPGRGRSRGRGPGL